MVNLGMQMIRKLGRFVEFSVFNDETTLDWSIIGIAKNSTSMARISDRTRIRAPLGTSAIERSTYGAS